MKCASRWFLLLLPLVGVTAATPAAPDPQTPDEAVAERVSLTLGIYDLAYPKAVTDGDTIKVEGLDATLRLLGIDTEETYKDQKDRYEAEIDFERYAKAKRGDSSRPAKYATPMGERAKEWAQEWFAGIYQVRLERDDHRRTRGYYGRHLVYVFAMKDGEWTNYNVEAVRAGMTPYFTKYGRSERFHDEFVKAQEEARAAKRGIWGDEVPHYPDYDERLVWWDKRAEQIARFRSEHAGKPDIIELGVDEDWERLSTFVGREVTVFGTVSDLRLDKGVPFIANMGHRRGQDFSIVAFDEGALTRLGLQRFDGSYVYVRGEVGTYKDRPQFLATKVYKVWTEQ